jgi:AcrR family transcriptional regulator
MTGDDSTKAERAFNMLIMRSASGSEDLTTRARIRDAALSRFPRDGFGGTTIRAVAADAGVSPALVVHHFGSKDGLREACDHYVVRLFRETKEAALQEENLFSRSFAATAYQMAQPLLRYLGWALSRGHEAAGELFDEMVREGVEVSRIAIAKGLIYDSPDLETRVAVQMAMQLGAVVMHSHLQRALGIDPLTSDGLAAVTPAMLEILGGLFKPEVLEGIKDAYVEGIQDGGLLTA